MTDETSPAGFEDGRLHREGAAVPLFRFVREFLAARNAALEIVLPGGVPVEAALAALAPAERGLAQAMARPRRHEFAVGRIAARRALERTAPVADSKSKRVAGAVTILQGERGEPLWPDGIAGSITHTPGLVAAAVCRVQDPRAAGVGIDVERAARVLSEAAWRHVLSDDEEPRLAAIDDARTRILLFSAKESLYKALYPACGVFFGFEDASLWFDTPVAGQTCGRLTLRLERDLGDVFVRGQTFAGVWEVDGDWLLTAV